MRGEVAIAAGVLGLGVLLAIATARLPEAAGYVQVGPAAFPALVAAGLVVCGVLLLVQALRARIVAAAARFDARAFVWVAGGLIAQMALVGVVGFVISAVVLFVAVARGFGSQRLARDAVIGFVLALALYLVFTQLLGLQLGPRLGVF